jgi:hypothetical protein
VCEFQVALIGPQVILKALQFVGWSLIAFRQYPAGLRFLGRDNNIAVRPVKIYQ